MEDNCRCSDIEDAFDQLKVVNETKDTVLAIIGHDLRGPIGNIMQISELIAEKGNVSDSELYQYLGFIKDLSKSTFELLENLLQLATHNKNALSYNPTIISLNEIVDKKLANLNYRFAEKNITIEKIYSNVFTAYADRIMIESVIRNLLSNAIKFTKANGTIVITILQEVNSVKIKILDTGIGISEENINIILSDTQFHTTFGTNAEKGSGLGLKLCKSFIKLNGGELAIHSKLGVGSEFSFSLPIPQK
jgi:signal transduction histidine kinase